MTRLIRNLFLSLLNATLILVVLALFIGQNLTGRVEKLAVVFSQNLIAIEPLRQELAGTRAEIAGLRDDLGGLRTDPGAADRFQARLAALEIRLDGMQGAMQQVSQAPSDLIDRAIATAASEFAGVIIRIRGCAAPGGNPV